jgi:hypothetical protein
MKSWKQLNFSQQQLYAIVALGILLNRISSMGFIPLDGH